MHLNNKPLFFLKKKTIYEVKDLRLFLTMTILIIQFIKDQFAFPHYIYQDRSTRDQL